jgi:hypothetical protein
MHAALVIFLSLAVYDRVSNRRIAASANLKRETRRT